MCSGCEGEQKCGPSGVIVRLSSDPHAELHMTQPEGEASAPQEGKPLPQGHGWEDRGYQRGLGSAGSEPPAPGALEGTTKPGRMGPGQNRPNRSPFLLLCWLTRESRRASGLKFHICCPCWGIDESLLQHQVSTAMPCLAQVPEDNHAGLFLLVTAGAPRGSAGLQDAANGCGWPPRPPEQSVPGLLLTWPLLQPSHAVPQKSIAPVRKKAT